MTYAPFFNFGKLFLENTPLKPFTPLKQSIISKFVKG